MHDNDNGRISDAARSLRRFVENIRPDSKALIAEMEPLRKQREDAQSALLRLKLSIIILSVMGVFLCQFGGFAGLVGVLTMTAATTVLLLVCLLERVMDQWIAAIVRRDGRIRVQWRLVRSGL